MASNQRRDAIALLLHASQILKVQSTTKYCALSFFADRFLPWLESQSRKLEPDPEMLAIGKSKYNLQFFGLVFLWIAIKIHETRALSVLSLKDLANELIPDMHFTKRDFVDMALKFDIGTGYLLSDVLKDLLFNLRCIAKVGKLVKLQTGLEVLDLLYESENILLSYPTNVASSALLAVAYAISVPAKKCTFPLLDWLSCIAKVHKEEILILSRRVLMLIFNSGALVVSEGTC